VVVASLSHPRIANAITKDQLMDEDHAALSEKHGVQSFSVQAYQDLDCRVSYQGATLSNLLYVVSQSELITLAPRWIVDSYPYRDQLQVLTLPISSKPVAGYLTWHESSERDKGHEWLKAQVTDVAKQLIN
jgi:LysR family transcriptional activator for leuABCD operon